MFRPISAFLGIRYTQAKKKNGFVSFISLSSMLGIGLGVMVLITVLSVMNGFDKEIHRRFFGMAPEITVNHADGRLENWEQIESRLIEVPHVKKAAPYVGTQGLLAYEGHISPVVLTGILPEKEQNITNIQNKLLVGNIKELEHFGIILGVTLAEQLGVSEGDLITVMIPEATTTPAGMIPRFKRFKVAGIFSAGAGFNFDSKLAFIHLNDAQKLLGIGKAVTGIKLKIDEVFRAPEVSHTMMGMLGPDYRVGNWTDQFGEFFEAIRMEKNMMFLILMLIIAVAAFNLVSSLVMVVNDKQADIAILRTLGATPSQIMMIFVVQGMLSGIIGTVIGLIGGILLSYYTTPIVSWLQSIFDIQVLSSSIYFVDYLPSQILAADLMKVTLMALFMSLIATLYPAFRASRTVITEALRYE